MDYYPDKKWKVVLQKDSAQKSTFRKTLHVNCVLNYVHVEVDDDKYDRVRIVAINDHDDHEDEHIIPEMKDDIKNEPKGSGLFKDPDDILNIVCNVDKL